MKLQVKLTKGNNLITNNKFDSGYDLMAKGIRRVINGELQPEHILDDNEIFQLSPNETVLITTGVHIAPPNPVEISDGVYEVIEAQLRGRSGMSLKTDTKVKLGTIDNTYTSDIGVIFHNESNQPQTFKKDDRLGQLVFNKVIKFMPEAIIYVDELNETDRGNNGFGSSGVSGDIK